MSDSLLWRHIVLLTVGVYSSNRRVLYIIRISMTRRFQKSVGLFVCNANKETSVIDSRKIICIPGERAYHALQENKAILSKNIYFSKILDRLKKLCLCKMPTPPLLTVE